jgi:hypothetical protein
MLKLWLPAAIFALLLALIALRAETSARPARVAHSVGDGAAIQAGDGTAKNAKGGRITLAGSKVGSRLDPHLDVQWEVLYILSAVYDTLIYADGHGSPAR